MDSTRRFPGGVHSPSAVAAISRRDRILISTCLVVISALAWVYLVHLDRQMSSSMEHDTMMAEMGMSMNLPWTAADVFLTFMMWTVMMVGMMAPSAAPMILMYARVGRQATADGKPFAATGWFAGGYFLAWIGFSLVATIAQWALERAALLDSGMASVSNVLGGVVLVAAGVYQWTPLKDVCLTQCQTPLLFLMRHGGFRQDASGCLLLGLRHGAYCIGCCWVLVALLFVGGVMNVLWIALLALLILMEKLFPFGRWIARAAGVAFLVAGAWLLFPDMV